MGLTLILTTVALILAALYFLFKRTTSGFDSVAQSEITERGVPYLPFEDGIGLWSILTKERVELTKDAIIRGKGIRTFGYKSMMSNTILCAEPEIAQLVFSKEFTSFTNRRIVINNDPVFGSAMNTALDDNWKRLRSIVTPTFSAGSLRRMKPRIDETVANLLANFEAARNQSADIDVKKLFGAYTMDTIIQVAFGTKIDTLNDPTNPLIALALKVFSTDIGWKEFSHFLLITVAPKVAKLLNSRFAAETMDYFKEFSAEVVKKTKEKMQKNKDSLGSKATSFIEFVLEAEAEYERDEAKNGSAESTESQKSTKSAKFMTTNEIIAQMVLFLLAGYDTTATTITLASYLLALNPDSQEKLFEEIETVIRKLQAEPGNTGKDPIELITLENLPKFEYLTGVINETLRLYAPAQMTERTAGRDIVLETADKSVRIDLKEGDVVHFPIYSMHRDEAQFPDPESFQPERFIGPELQHHKYSYLPFGAGPRNCVAKSLALVEAKLGLLHTVRVYRFSRSSRTKVPFDMYFKRNFVSPKDIVLRVEKR